MSSTPASSAAPVAGPSVTDRRVALAAARGALDGLAQVLWQVPGSELGHDAQPDADRHPPSDDRITDGGQLGAAALVDEPRDLAGPVRRE